MKRLIEPGEVLKEGDEVLYGYQHEGFYTQKFSEHVGGVHVTQTLIEGDVAFREDKRLDVALDELKAWAMLLEPEWSDQQRYQTLLRVIKELEG